MKKISSSTFSLLKKIIETSQETIYLLIILVIPIWFSFLFPTYNMFELSKLAIFRGLTSLLLIFTVFRFILYFYFAPNRFDHIDIFKNIWQSLKKYFIFATLLIIGLIISLLFSLNWQQSFFGSYERQQGLISHLFYFIFAVLMFVNLLFDRHLSDPYFGFSSALSSKLRRIIIVATFSSLIVAVYGILQIMNIDFLTWPEPPFLTGRTLSTMGQPNFLASFLLLTIPLGFYLVTVSKRFFWRFFYFLTAILQIICLFFTASRGGLLAFIAVIFLFGLYLFFHSHLNKKIKWLVIIGVIFIGIIGLVVMEKTIPGRIKESFNLRQGSLAARVYFFQAAADAALSKPYFGYGLENSGEVFIRYYERDWGTYGDVSANTDRAHNLILDILVWTGFIGLILFTIWYYTVLKLGYLQIKNSVEKKIAMALTLGLAGYLISLLFSFAIVAGEVYFWLFFTLIAILAASTENKESFISEKIKLFVRQTSLFTYFKKIKNKFSYSFRFNRQKKTFQLIPLVIGLILIILATLHFKQATKTMLADYYVNEINAAINRLEFVRAGQLREQIFALQINPVQMNQYDYYLGNYLTNYCFYSEFRDLSEEKIIIHKLATIQVNLPEFGYKNIFLHAKIASCLKQNEIADYYFSELEKITPAWPLAYLNRGLYLVKRGELALAESYYQLADFNLPDLDSQFINQEHRRAAENYKFLMYNNLGVTYFQLGNYVRAEKFFQEAFRHRPEDYSLFKKIADTYYFRSDFETALKYIYRGRAANPQDYSWPLAAAAILLEQGNEEKALEELEKTRSLAPEESVIQINELKKEYNLE